MGVTDMEDFPKPVVIVSRCLGFAKCRYNGQTIPNRAVERLGAYVEYRTVCPEVEIGLGIPRDPVRVVDNAGRRILFQPSTGKDVTEDMESFCAGFLDAAGAVDGFILKNRSPSCGPWDVKVYRGMGKDASCGRGKGLFGEAVTERFPGKPVEDEGRLDNFSVREHFLTRLFALARFRSVKALSAGGETGPEGAARPMAARPMRALVDYHTRHKYLLMAYSQARLKLLGNIVANGGKKSAGEVFSLYETHLEAALAKPPRSGQLINVLLHAFGGMSENLLPEERRFFQNGLEEYRDERIPLGVLLHLLEAWAVRLENGYLLGQTLLKPYPLELVEVSDSGKGRDY
jgi:uncharacterized protein YbbK (DUF523 family)/uncharacterized protein YbgA (DUF1722 family)